VICLQKVATLVTDLSLREVGFMQVGWSRKMHVIRTLYMKQKQKHLCCVFLLHIVHCMVYFCLC